MNDPAGKRQIPNWSGQIKCPGLHNELSIFRDEHGIPYIQAKQPEEAWFGLGFCQGQDRAFQIEVSLRNSKGTLSEIFGEQTLPADKLARVIGFQRLAEQYWVLMEQPERELLNAFTAGINNGVKLGSLKKPVEFSRLGFDFTPVTPVDVIAFHLLLTFSLSHWVPKITRFKLLLEGDPEIVSGLDPAFASWNYLTCPVGEKAGVALDYLLADILTAQETINLHGMSNNWVISANRSATGHPIIANDPHLAAGIPAPWYLANIECDDFRLSGACLTGSPLFLAGYNQHVAWGVTAGFIDNIDLYLEDISADGNLVKRGNKYQPLEKVIEEIKVRDHPTYRYEIPVTDRGPFISSLMLEKTPALTMAATWMRPQKIWGFFRVPLAKSVNEFNDHFRNWPLFSLNLVSADDQDNTAWLLAGEIPVRKKSHGLLPLPGWDPSFEWEAATVPFADHPRMVNPETDFIATANNKPIDDYERIYIGRDFIDGYRHARIIELIQNHRGKIGFETCRKFQTDQHSKVWSEIRASVLAHPCSSQNSLKAIKQLKHWDGTVSADSVPASVFEAFMAEFAKMALDSMAGNLTKWIPFTFVEGLGASCFGPSRISQLVMLIKEKQNHDLISDIDGLIERALARAWSSLEERYGANIRKWKWGLIRPLVLNHVLASLGSDEIKQTMAGKLTLGPVPYGGDEQCISVAAGKLTDISYKPDTIPNLRMVVEVGNWEKNYFSLAGGVSGDLETGYYDDLFKLWIKGKGVSLKTSPDQHEYILLLRPESPASD
jgi:penicillin G amidase